MDDVRRGYKRAAAQQAQPHVVLALRTGEVRCPMKFSILGIEACSQIQKQGANCHLYNCRYLGCVSVFANEAARVKEPTIRPRKKANAAAEAA